MMGAWCSHGNHIFTGMFPKFWIFLFFMKTKVKCLAVTLTSSKCHFHSLKINYPTNYRGGPKKLPLTNSNLTSSRTSDKPSLNRVWKVLSIRNEAYLIDLLFTMACKEIVFITKILSMLNIRRWRHMFSPYHNQQS